MVQKLTLHTLWYTASAACKLCMHRILDCTAFLEVLQFFAHCQNCVFSFNSSDSKNINSLSLFSICYCFLAIKTMCAKFKFSFSWSEYLLATWLLTFLSVVNFSKRAFDIWFGAQYLQWHSWCTCFPGVQWTFSFFTLLALLMLAHPFCPRVALDNGPIRFLPIAQSLGSSITAQLFQAQSKRTTWICADSV